MTSSVCHSWCLSFPTHPPKDMQRAGLGGGSRQIRGALSAPGPLWPRSRPESKPEEARGVWLCSLAEAPVRSSCPGERKPPDQRPLHTRSGRPAASPLHSRVQAASLASGSTSPQDGPPPPRLAAGPSHH